MFLTSLLTIAVFVAAAHGLGVKNIILTNDDGWAVAQIRAQNTALKRAGFNVSSHKHSIICDAGFIQLVFQVVLSAPTENESGTGSSTAPPTVLTEPCEFDTCPAGSPATGANATNRESFLLRPTVVLLPVDAYVQTALQHGSTTSTDTRKSAVI